MKNLAALVLIGAVATICSHAETLESLKTRTGKEYFKVEILEHDAVGLKIRHDAGTARVPFEILPDDIQAKYQFSHKEAQAQKTREAQELRQHGKAQPSGPKAASVIAPAPSRRAPAPEGVKIPQSDATLGNPKLLEAEVLAIRQNITVVTRDITQLEKRAAEERMNITTPRRIDYGPRNGYQPRPSTNKGSEAKVRKYEKEIAEHKAKISKAEFLIEAKKARYLQITGTELNELVWPPN